MKKVLTLLVLCMVMVCASAQTHMKFLGIPLDGHIDTFSTKLKAKGATISPRNKYADVGLRIFDGKFYDNLCEFWVSYDERTKNVYQVRVNINSNKKTVLESLKEEIEGVIEDKYTCTHDNGKTKGGNPIDVYYIFDLDTDEYAYGVIYIGVSTETEYPFDNLLSITYMDIKNSDKHENSKSDDI